MTVVVAMTQPLRVQQAATFLSSLPVEGRKVLLTGNPTLISEDDLPEGTDIRASAPSLGPRPSARALSTNAATRAAQWTKGGSRLGVRVDRWFRSAEWRLRYVDRVFTVIESGRRRRSPFNNDLMVEELMTIAAAEGLDQIAVFDLFDLPAVMSVSRAMGCEVVIL